MRPATFNVFTHTDAPPNLLKLPGVLYTLGNGIKYEINEGW